MKPGIALGAIALIAAGPSAAAEICEEFQGLRSGGADLYLHLPAGERKTDCTTSRLLSGGTQVHCGFGFDYRIPAATVAFDGLVAAVTDCLGETARVTGDLNVNHPDFYDLQTFRLEGQEIAVSLKDKAALLRTYVFVRVSVSK